MLNTLINFIFSLRLKLRSIPLSCVFTCLLFAAVISVAAKKPPISVIAYQVQKINQPQHIKALGNLQANQAIQIFANVTEAMHFKDGQNVRKNQLLIELNNLEELALLAEAYALTDEAKSQYQRVKDVLGRGSMTRSLVDGKRSIWPKWKKV